MKHFKRDSLLMGIISLVLPFILLLGGCSQSEVNQVDEYAELEGAEGFPEPILSTTQTTTVIRGDVLDREIFSGILTPYAEELSFPAEGYFGTYNVTLGQEVKAGDVLAVTDLEASSVKLDLLKEKLQSLEDNYSYQLALYNNQLETQKLQLEQCYLEIDSIPQYTEAFTDACTQAGLLDGEIKRTQLYIKQLQEEYDFEKPYLVSQIDTLKEEMENNIIVAPFDGVIVQLEPMLNGDWIEKSSPCVVLADTSRCCVVADYLQRTTAEKSKNFEAFIDGEFYEASYHPIDADVYSDLIQKSEKAYSTYLLKEDGIADLYGYGHSALVVVTKNMSLDVLMVSNLGVLRDGSQYYCYVDHNGQKEKVILTIGLRDELNTEIISGLEEGDVVYIE